MAGHLDDSEGVKRLARKHAQRPAQGAQARKASSTGGSGSKGSEMRQGEINLNSAWFMTYLIYYASWESSMCARGACAPVSRCETEYEMHIETVGSQPGEQPQSDEMCVCEELGQPLQCDELG